MATELAPYPDRTPVVLTKTGMSSQPWSNWFLNVWTCLREVASAVAAASTQFLVQHNANGTHGAVTATSVATSGALTAGGLLTTNGQAAFPATQNPSTNVHILDDYEEGSFTPANTNMPVTAGGRYQKVGNSVHVQAEVLWPSNADGNQANISALPFASINAFPRGSVVIGYTNAAIAMTGLVQINSTQILLYKGAGAAVTNAELTGASVVVSAFYTATQ